MLGRQCRRPWKDRHPLCHSNGRSSLDIRSETRNNFQLLRPLQDPLNRGANRWCQWGMPIGSRSHRRPQVANPAVPLSQPNGHHESAELPKGASHYLHTRCGRRHRGSTPGTVRPAGGSQQRWGRWQPGAPCSECCRSL